MCISLTINFTYIFYLPLYLVAHVNFLLNEYDDDDDDDDDDDVLCLSTSSSSSSSLL